MSAAPQHGLLGFLILVIAALVVIAYVFLRMAGVVGHGRRGRPPPPTPLG